MSSRLYDKTRSRADNRELSRSASADTCAWSGLAKLVHHARAMVKQRHITVAGQPVDVPSFMVRVDSEKMIDFAPSSALGSSGKLGRLQRRKHCFESQRLFLRQRLSPCL
ncbi:MAG: 40S ribosomal protein S9-like protein [Amphiamblys sp. WSBS2006]|nr:MAG: 40S ribosomal protein S9-like protein [Amphiamblys sp. WSBS2006]